MRHYVHTSCIHQKQEIQGQTLGVLLSQSNNNIGALLNPQFVYKRGTLWMSEMAALKAVAHCGCNVDQTFVLTFDKKVPKTMKCFMFEIYSEQ